MFPPPQLLPAHPCNLMGGVFELITTIYNSTEMFDIDSFVMIPAVSEPANKDQAHQAEFRHKTPVEVGHWGIRITSNMVMDNILFVGILPGY